VYLVGFIVRIQKLHFLDQHVIDRYVFVRGISAKTCKKLHHSYTERRNTLYTYIEKGKHNDVPCTNNIECQNSWHK